MEAHVFENVDESRLADIAHEQLDHARKRLQLLVNSSRPNTPTPRDFGGNSNGAATARSIAHRTLELGNDLPGRDRSRGSFSSSDSSAGSSKRDLLLQDHIGYRGIDEYLKDGYRCMIAEMRHAQSEINYKAELAWRVPRSCPRILSITHAWPLLRLNPTFPSLP